MISFDSDSYKDSTGGTALGLLSKGGPLQIQVHEKLTGTHFQEIESLEKQVFKKTYRPGHFRAEAPTKPRLLALLGYEDNHLVAYKVGYALKTDTFYSWVGGVHPDHRRKGWALEMMNHQHHLLKDLGYKAVRTKTRSNYRGMLILNLHLGFEITGVSTKPRIPGLIIQMEKPLN